MALPLHDTAVAAPQHDATRLAPHRIKRCNYRRLISLERPKERAVTPPALAGYKLR